MARIVPFLLDPDGPSGRYVAKVPVGGRLLEVDVTGRQVFVLVPEGSSQREELALWMLIQGDEPPEIPLAYWGYRLGSFIFTEL